ncbi:hypothetical protein L3X38_010391 [Prunus dulcis]|uniref:Uncharacterized protein n=1 Tax=Prunus dulcis TaxID=3755 RepID=A0AAD4ZEE1_PRUDU|nr:hypothetical protein L3X38_010391 [Prunus dulcis]
MSDGTPIQCKCGVPAGEVGSWVVLLSLAPVPLCASLVVGFSSVSAVGSSRIFVWLNYENSKVKRVGARAIPGWVTHWEAAGLEAIDSLRRQVGLNEDDIRFLTLPPPILEEVIGGALLLHVCLM